MFKNNAHIRKLVHNTSKLTKHIQINHTNQKQSIFQMIKMEKHDSVNKIDYF